MTRVCPLPVIGFALTAFGCVDTGQDRATIPLRLAGTAVTEPVPGASGWIIELDRAELAFGPLYLCSGAQAGALCDTARLEWVESAVVDTLAPEPRDAGELSGVTGPVRSWMYDLGITSLLTQQRPVILPAARDLGGGNSVVLAGFARSAVRTIRFHVELPIQQDEATEIGVSVVRKSGSDAFYRDVTGAEAALVVRFDPRPWVREIDFEALVESAGEVVFTSESQGYRAVRTALVAGARPAFEWSDVP